jgi:ABC-type multidrug transport system fused ATPase/permease subunit
MGPHRGVRWLAGHARSSLPHLLGGVFCTLIVTASVLLDPLIMKWLIDEALPQRHIKFIFIATGAYALTFCCRLAFNGMGSIIVFRASQKMAFRVRLNLLRHLQTLSAEYHGTVSVGDILYRLEQDIDQVTGLLADFLTFLARSVLASGLILTLMLVLNLRLTCVVLPTVPIFILLTRRYRSRLRVCSELAQDRATRRSSFLQEHLSSIVQIQLLCRELTEARKFARLARSAMRMQVRRRSTELVFAFLLLSLIETASVAILGYGGYLVICGALSIGGLVAFYTYLERLFGSLGGALDIYSEVQRARVSVQRILQIVEADAAIVDRPGACSLSCNARGYLQLNGVEFRYRQGRTVLDGVSFNVNGGEKIALVGLSGSGKSTIAKLVTRVYDVSDGEILVDGIDIRDVSVKSLRSTVALVPQDPVLFDATLRENLLYGNPKASEAQLDEAVTLAQLRSIIERLPKGWNEMIGARGYRLSGGERQRVAMARAILQRPRILILDEATSALDAQTENQLLDALKSFVEARTVIIISHRLPPALWADRVLTLHNGRIAEERSSLQFRSDNGTFSLVLGGALQTQEFLARSGDPTAGG